MMKSRVPSRSTWIIVYIIVPMIPFIVGGIIRLIVCLKFSLTTFKAADLAICFALSAVFIGEFILRSERILDNEDKREEAAKKSRIFFLCSLGFMSAFTLITALDTIVQDSNLPKYRVSANIVEIIIFLAIPFLVRFSIITQGNLKLKAKLL